MSTRKTVITFVAGIGAGALGFMSLGTMNDTQDRELKKMTYYSVFAVTPTSEEWIPDYVGISSALLAKHGGKYLARTANHERLEGNGEDAALRVVVEWPSKEAAEAFMNDPAYAPHLKARTNGSISHHFLIEGKDDLT